MGIGLVSYISTGKTRYSVVSKGGRVSGEIQNKTRKRRARIPSNDVKAHTAEGEGHWETGGLSFLSKYIVTMRDVGMIAVGAILVVFVLGVLFVTGWLC